MRPGDLVILDPSRIVGKRERADRLVLFVQRIGHASWHDIGVRGYELFEGNAWVIMA